MSRDSVPESEYESFLADSDKFFDELDHETDTTHSPENILKIMETMNILSDSEREKLNENLLNNIPDDGITSLGESDYEFYGYLFLNVIVFMSFGKRFSFVICHSTPHQARSIITSKSNEAFIKMYPKYT